MAKSVLTFLILQISSCEGAQEAIVALPCQVPNVVPAALGAAGDHGGVRAGRVRVLRLGGLVVPAQEERLPVRV